MTLAAVAVPIAVRSQPAFNELVHIMITIKQHSTENVTFLQMQMKMLALTMYRQGCSFSVCWT